MPAACQPFEVVSVPLAGARRTGGWVGPAACQRGLSVESASSVAGSATDVDVVAGLRLLQ